MSLDINKIKVHFVGVGGIGMSALAELFHMMGAEVSGSDVKANRQTDKLTQGGLEISIGHRASQVGVVDVVVYSSAVPQSNPEIQEALCRGIPVIGRAEALSEIMRHKRAIAVGGTHGKTTTTSMIGSILLHNNEDPTIALGGRLELIQSTARLGQGPWVVVEADESDGSFHRLYPEVALVTNVDRDHLDYFGSFGNLQQAFKNFALNIPFYGTAIVHGDDPDTRTLFKSFTKKILFYGENPENDFYLKKKGSDYFVFSRGEPLGGLDLKVPGHHNALNALGACLACLQTGLSWRNCLDGMNRYQGVDRRFQLVGKKKGIYVLDDYAHHPTEIEATLQAARDRYSGFRIHVIYQPHRYSRIQNSWQGHQVCFDKAHRLYLLDIYPAGESPLEGIHSQRLSQLIKIPTLYCSDFEGAVRKVMKEVRAGDVVLTMGAGDVWKCAELLVEKLTLEEHSLKNSSSKGFLGKKNSTPCSGFEYV